MLNGMERLRGPFTRTLPQKISKAVVNPVERCGSEMLALMCPEDAALGITQPRGSRQDCVEHGREVAGRGIDDLQDFGHRGLLSLGFVALHERLIKPSLKIGHLVVERRRHVLAPS